MIEQSTFNFLADLEQNNNKDWFDLNRKKYQKAKDNFVDFIDKVIEQLSVFDHHLAGLSAKDCLFRINRDIRFSKNKAPYKTNFGAYIAFGGRKSEYAGYFFHLKPGECFLGGGMYKPSTPVLRKIRQEIDYNASQIKEIINQKQFTKTFGSLKGEKLVTAPKGYPKDHPEIELLKFKSYFVMHALNESDLMSANAVEHCAELFKVVFPFNRFFNETFIS
ncbi:MAG: DUF2461 domain-containing protein [Bacteroidia bacterium]